MAPVPPRRAPPLKLTAPLIEPLTKSVPTVTSLEPV
jgi:hypothetical protein